MSDDRKEGKEEDASTPTRKRLKSSTSLGQLLSRKKVLRKPEEKDVEFLLNDFDLDANAIFSWFRGATDSIPLSTEKKKEIIKQEKNDKKEYSILIDKESTELPKKQLCDNCYEKLPFLQIDSKTNAVFKEIPMEIRNHIQMGFFEGTFKGKLILYICNNYYIDYNFTLQGAIYLASSLSIPLIVLLLRPIEEYSYPFSPHALHILHHLCSFQSELLSLSITPLLLFTSSISATITQFVKETEPLLILTESFADIRYQYDFSFLLSNNQEFASKVWVFSNHPPLRMDAKSIYLPPDVYKFYSNQYKQLLSIPQVKRSPQSLDPFTQLKIAYSLQAEESFYSRQEDTICIDFSDCVLILPPMLTTSTVQMESSSDFCYGRNEMKHHVANWGDIRHELHYFHSTLSKLSSYDTLLENEQWYYPYFCYAPNSKGLYHLIGPLRSCFVSEYSVYTQLKEHAIPEERLAEIVSVNQYYNAFLLKHMNAIVRSDPIYLLPPGTIKQIEQIINQCHRQVASDNLIHSIQTIMRIEGQLPFSLFVYYIQHLLLTLYKFELGSSLHFSLLPILNKLKEISMASPFNDAMIGEILRCLILICQHFEQSKSLFKATDFMDKITDYSKFLKGVAELEQYCNNTE